MKITQQAKAPNSMVEILNADVFTTLYSALAVETTQMLPHGKLRHGKLH
jgi:hypothetical protein